jgi:hypothetical protein
MWGHLKVTYEAQTQPHRVKLDCSEPDHVEPNQAPHRQIVTYKQNREQSTTEVNRHMLLSSYLIHCLVLYRSKMFWKLALFSFSSKEAPKHTDPLDQAILSHWVPYEQWLVKICTLERI